MAKKKVVVAKADFGKAVKQKEFDPASMQVETGIKVAIRSQEASGMYDALDKLDIGQSYKMPAEAERMFTNARVAHKRTTKKVFIFRKIDSYNIRCWRVADDTILTRRTKKKK
jgi:hypothetical protein